MKERGDEYLRGYRAAMEYAAEFSREAGAGTPFAKLMDVLAGHLEEKVISTERAVDLETRMTAELKRLGYAEPGQP